MYMLYWWKRHIATDKLFATQVANLDSVVMQANDRYEKKEESKSHDMILMEKEDNEDVLWGKKGWSANSSILKNRLNEAFVRCCVPKSKHKDQHDILCKHGKSMMLLSPEKFSSLKPFVSKNLCRLDYRQSQIN